MKAPRICLAALLLLAAWPADAISLRRTSRAHRARTHAHRAQAKVRLHLRSHVRLEEELEITEDSHAYILDTYAHLTVAVRQLEHFLALNGTSNNSVAHSKSGNVTQHLNATGNHSMKANGTSHNLHDDAKARLAKEQGVLKGLIQHLKGNIGKFTKEDKKGKHDTDNIVERLQKRLAADRKKLNSSTISDGEHEILVNRTNAEEREMEYWSKERSIQKDMLHANLRMTHGLMARVATILDAYSKVLKTGKLDKEMTDKLRKVTDVLPKAMIETRDELERHALLQTEHIRRRLERSA